MLNVKTPDEVIKIIDSLYLSFDSKSELVDLLNACGRVLHFNISSDENVPNFNRSTVDGYAVRASDTFGCNESIPAILNIVSEVLMGESADVALATGDCAIVSTGGELPESADAVVMVEHSENYGENIVGIQKPVAPGNNVIFNGDDVRIGQEVLKDGTVLTPHDIGILAALGHDRVEVRVEPVVGVISTGDELVPTSRVPVGGQVRDINTPMLLATVTQLGAKAMDFGIVKDDEQAIRNAVLSAVETCDICLISGGSSAGARDMTARVIESEGELLLHGIAMKPGKPTILGIVRGKLVFGLPGHPVAAYMVTELFVRPLINRLLGSNVKRYSVDARLAEAISSNHGRAEYIGVSLIEVDGVYVARPIRGKSGLISSLSGVDGYICVPRDCEGLAKGEAVKVVYF
ncbi:MAG: molybdopterin molybdotransferase MoeA [Oscillospiraceae bacterium]|nr:molybdopterin molybdotransferase MoeA [Oscillospiraceae bacterium]